MERQRGNRPRSRHEELQSMGGRQSKEVHGWWMDTGGGDRCVDPAQLGSSCPCAPRHTPRHTSHAARACHEMPAVRSVARIGRGEEAARCPQQPTPSRQQKQWWRGQPVGASILSRTQRAQAAGERRTGDIRLGVGRWNASVNARAAFEEGGCFCRKQATSVHVACCPRGKVRTAGMLLVRWRGCLSWWLRQRNHGVAVLAHASRQLRNSYNSPVV